MSSTVYHESDSTDNLPDLNFDPDIRVVLCDGNPAEVWSESGRYYVKPLAADLPYRFNTLEAFKTFEAAHISEVEDTDPTPEPTPAIIPFPVREAVQVAAISEPRIHEHIIRLDNQTCISCGEHITKYVMCHECALRASQENKPHSETIRMQHYMMARTGLDHPLRAHDAFMTVWLAEHAA